MAESNGSLLPGLWLTSPAGWLPRTGISSGTVRSVIEYGLRFLPSKPKGWMVVCVCIVEGSIKSSLWTSSRYIDLNCPLSPCVSLQWTIRDSGVVNLPCTLLVEGDVILLRPGQIVCVKCRRLKVDSLWHTFQLNKRLQSFDFCAFPLTLLVGWQEGHPAWVVRCWHGYLSGARCRLAYMARLMPLPLTVSCFSKIQIGFITRVVPEKGR